MLQESLRLSPNVPSHGAAPAKRWGGVRCRLGGVSCLSGLLTSHLLADSAPASWAPVRRAWEPGHRASVSSLPGSDLSQQRGQWLWGTPGRHRE